MINSSNYYQKQYIIFYNSFKFLHPFTQLGYFIKGQMILQHSLLTLKNMHNINKLSAAPFSICFTTNLHGLTNSSYMGWTFLSMSKYQQLKFQFLMLQIKHKKLIKNNNVTLFQSLQVHSFFHEIWILSFFCHFVKTLVFHLANIHQANHPSQLLFYHLTKAYHL